MSQETFEETFQVEGNPSVTIGNVRGLVTVQPGEAGVVTIKAVKLSSGSESSDIRIWQEEDGSVHAKVDVDKTNTFFNLLRNPAKVEFTVTVPPEVNLAVSCVSADADVQGLQGELSLKTVSGKVAVHDVSGNLRFESVSGRITGDHVHGPLRIKTVSGTVILKESDVPQLKATSVSGRMELDTPMGEGPYDLKTVSGSVNLRVPEETGGVIRFKSISGRARLGQKAVRHKNGSSRPGAPRRQIIELDGEGPEIKFNSVSGNLNLIGPDNGLELDAVEFEETPVPAAPADRMTILERIASGEMSVEDGVAAMKE